MFLHYAAPSIRRKIINSKKAFLAVFQKPLEWPEPGKPMADALVGPSPPQLGFVHVFNMFVSQHVLVGSFIQSCLPR